MPVNGIALGAGVAGSVFLYSALMNKSILSTTKSIIQGKQPTPGPQQQQQGSSGGPGSQIGVNLVTSTLGVSGSNTGNQALGQLMAAAYGWGTGANWAFLRTGWREESGWRVDAANVPSDPYNHAYGIPQANPGTKMASAGADWQTSAATQIKWGLAYIKATYGAPVNVPGWSANGPVAGYQGY
jgi:hypothetical protein